MEYTYTLGNYGFNSQIVVYLINKKDKSNDLWFGVRVNGLIFNELFLLKSKNVEPELDERSIREYLESGKVDPFERELYILAITESFNTWMKEAFDLFCKRLAVDGVEFEDIDHIFNQAGRERLLSPLWDKCLSDTVDKYRMLEA